MKHNWSEKASELEGYLRSGWTLTQAAGHYGISKQAISLAVRKYLPHLDRRDYGYEKLAADRNAPEKERKRMRGVYNGEYIKQSNPDLVLAFAEAFTRKRQNVKGSKWEWSITKDDIYWPTHCPILGIELNWFADVRTEASPSFDRIDPTKGYVKGNVAIMSWRANRIKNDGTTDEHLKIAKWMEENLS